MKFLLLGKGSSIKAIKKYIKNHHDEYVQAVFEHEYSSKYLLADEQLLKLKDINYAIKSPGISETNKIYLKLSQKFTFISEIDLLTIYNEKIKTIVVTGSNGKTTFVSMLHFLFNKAKIKSIVCGNSFKPITSYYKKFNKLDYLIIEQSSFQLHDLKFFSPYISIILNMQDNHLDSSYSLRSYFENKKNIYKYQNKDCFFIYDNNNINLIDLNTSANVIDLLTYPLMDNINSNLIKYSNNINYIYTIYKILGIKDNIIKLNQFKTLPFREQIVYKDEKLLIINDSKSTSVDATLFALLHISNLKDTILIIGGKDKQLSLERLNKINVKTIICYGQLVKKAQSQIKNVILCKNLKDALQIAKNILMDNKIILFSPSTSSFDQFSSYVERGKYFNKLVKNYVKNKKD